MANRLFSAAELLLSKPMSSNHIVKKTMAVHGNDPIIPCRTIIWNVLTFITDLVATQESLQIEGGGRTSLLDKCSLS
uniref:Uncharacterized protein n=1 Tax=Arundo donax TaxID=35708 RepID=A0A0A9E7X8_ARUDO